ncbi:hypothetical protein PbJCM13498_07520 [Prolixibacter bellariivorans]|uniref:Glutaredoxin domain-containing protein n=1 Tax=Prolixibacter bellariivorans TaxID=314319 RepID=A0A5M4AVB9_9BACT|nr:glutaredoxin domain-containing protein [Prolixibacter bellariivorans]GET31889.1 hypothetical protein PbJCM13498_07520 [Prolixibacter bellariivorans]
MKQIHSFEELKEAVETEGKSYLLLYKSSGSEQNNCALKAVESAADKAEKAIVLTADVATVRDIHPEYGITSVPSLLEFENGGLKKVVKGCSEENFYQNLFEGGAFHASATGDKEKPQKNVVVYSTPTCTWCNTIKSYFRDNNIRFRDIDVSRDQKAAEEMVKRSGQQGVPQTLINGQVVVGFDKARIDALLGIR